MNKPSTVHDWLGVPNTGQPVDYYLLLGLPKFESSREAIEAAWQHRQEQVEPHISAEPERASRLMLRLNQARDILLDDEKRGRYDAKLRSLASGGRPKSEVAADSSSSPSRRRLVIVSLAAIVLVATASVGLMAMRLGGSASQPVAQAQPQAKPQAALPTPGPSPVAENPPSPMEETKSDSEPAAANAAPRELDLPSNESEIPQVSKSVSEPPKEAPVKPADAVPAAPPPASVEQPGPSVPPDPMPEAKPAVAVEDELPAPESRPQPPPAIENRAQREEYVRLVSEMLEAGLKKSPNRDQARAAYEKALQLCGSDPRLHYGFALTLHTVQREEARKLLLLAMKEGAYGYPAAWRLLIEMELKKSIDEKLVAGLAKFAERLEQASGDWPDEATQIEFAMFLGRVMGYCQGPSGAGKRLADELSQADQTILASLGATRRKAYELGKLDVVSQAEDLEENATKAAEAAAQAASAKQSDQERKLESDKQGLTDSEQKLKRKQEEYEEKWNKLKADFQRDWTAMQAEYNSLVQQVQTLQQAIIAGEEKIAAIDAQMSAIGAEAAAKRQSPPNLAGFQELKSQIRGQITVREIELRSLYHKGIGLSVKVQTRLSEMARAEVEYQRATGQLVKESDFISDKRKTLNAQSSKLAKQKTGKKQSAAPANDLNRFSHYAPFDVQTEKQRLLDSYQTQP